MMSPQAISNMQNVLLVNRREAARMLGLSERTVFTLTENGTLPTIRFGIRGVRYSVRALENFIEQQLAASPLKN